MQAQIKEEDELELVEIVDYQSVIQNKSQQQQQQQQHHQQQQQQQHHNEENNHHRQQQQQQQQQQQHHHVLLYDMQGQSRLVPLRPRIANADNENTTIQSNHYQVEMSNSSTTTEEGHSISDDINGETRTHKEIIINKELLISAVRPHPEIWQPSHPQYQDHAVKKMSWQQIRDEHFKDLGGGYFFIFLF